MKMSEQSAIISLMVQHHGGQPEKVYRTMKIYSFVHAIAAEEDISDEARGAAEKAAILCEMGESSAESASFSDMLLLNLGCDRSVIQKVHNLIVKLDDTENIDTIEQQILYEARFLVNAFENRLDKETIVENLMKNFKTKCGQEYLCNIFSVGNRRKSDNNIGGDKNA